MRTNCLYSIFLIVLLCAFTNVNAQTPCFTVGTADDETTTTGDWSTGTNWSGASPGCDIATQDQTVEVDVDMTVQDTNCATLTMSGQDTALQVVNSSTLTIEGNFDSSGEGVCIYVETGATLIIEGNFILNGESVDLRVDGDLQVLGDFIVANEMAVLNVEGSLSITGELTCSGTCESGSTSFPGSGTITSGGGCTGDFGAECSSALPIELIYFQSLVRTNNVTLNWATASEENNDFFTIERSSNGINYHVLTNLPGAGNSFQTLNYSYVDQLPLPGVSYYRLKQTDYDGTSETFRPVVVEFYGDTDRIKVVQQISNPNELLIFNNLDEENKAVIYDIMGKLIVEFSLIQGKNNIDLHQLNSRKGIYLLRVFNAVGRVMTTEKILIQ